MSETKLIVTTDEAAAGRLKAAGTGTQYFPVTPRLIWSALPEKDSLSELHELAAQHQRTEFWIDPDPNAQLAMLMLLDQADLGKSWIYQSATRLGDGVPDRWLISTLKPRPVEAADVELASKLWNAYKAPSPEGMPGFLKADPANFPFLRQALLELLEELPDIRDGLGTTQRAFLRMLANHDRLPEDLLIFRGEAEKPLAFNYWQLGAILDDLCSCAQPAISGLEGGPFDLAMHEDSERFQHYFESRLTLTEFGQALLDGKADFAKENKIERWWGGTTLSNEALWRWDGERGDVLQIL